MLDWDCLVNFNNDDYEEEKGMHLRILNHIRDSLENSFFMQKISEFVGKKIFLLSIVKIGINVKSHNIFLLKYLQR